MRGGGSKAVWNFSENSSVWVGPSVPKSRADEDGGGESPPVGWTYCTGTSFWVKPLETTWFYFS